MQPIGAAAKKVRGLAEAGDELALAVFEQQAMALGRLFTIAANFTDPHAYFLGGGVVEADAAFPCLVPGPGPDATRTCATSRRRWRRWSWCPDRDMAGARGAAIAARDAFDAGEAELAVV